MGFNSGFKGLTREGVRLNFVAIHFQNHKNTLKIFSTLFGRLSAVMINTTLYCVTSHIQSNFTLYTDILSQCRLVQQLP